VDLDYVYSFTANTVDSGANDYIAIVMTDGRGTPLDLDFSVTLWGTSRR
jgi:hypothetical protein